MKNHELGMYSDKITTNNTPNTSLSAKSTKNIWIMFRKKLLLGSIVLDIVTNKISFTEILKT